MRIDTFRLRLVVIGALLALSSSALAGFGQPTPWEMGLQVPNSEGAEYIHWFHDLLVWIITAITLFVLALLVYVMVRFNEKRNTAPTRTTHNSLLEVAWTVLPVLILVVIAIPSFRLLRRQLVVPDPDVVVKATGHQWYWSYDYPPDQGGFAFDSNLVPEGELQPGQLRLLTVDNEMVLPVDKIVKVQVTAADVIHAFAMPAFGVKVDAVPGRLNETWFKAEKEGTFRGQCSLICGQNHAYMPIVIRVVSDKDYAAWIEEAKKKYAAGAGPGAPIAVAAGEGASR